MTSFSLKISEMKSEFHLLAIILISIDVKSGESALFCDLNGGNDKLVDAVFNIKDDIYLVRGEDIWISNILMNGGKPDPTSFKIKQKFKGLFD